MSVCPICKLEAEEIEPGTDRTVFRCRNHQEFGVSDTALLIYSKLPQDRWEVAFRRAKARIKPGQRPFILNYDFLDREDSDGL